MGSRSFLQELGGKLIKKAGLQPKATTNFGKFDQNDLPWAKQKQKDAFFKPAVLEPERVDGIFPYRLLVIDVTKEKNKSQNRIVGSGGFPRDTDVVKYASDTGGVNYRILGVQNEWEFRLPITPQQLQITDQFAINTTATMRGIVEEHNGVKFKMISASGTTGIWPTRQTYEDPNSGGGNFLFGGTVEALGGVVDSFNQLKNGGKSPPTSLNPLDDDGGVNTGYFQALLLQQFLEQYAMAKKDPAKKGWRLVFDCPKMNQSFIVTPVQYSVTKSQRSPGEHIYNMQFKAWKRVDVNGTPTPVPSKVQTLNPNFFQKINNTLDNARSLMSASLNTIKAVRADFRKPFDTLRKITLLTKDFSGLALSISDLPNQIGKDITAATKKRSKDLAQSEANFKAAFDNPFSTNRDKRAEAKARAIVSAIAAEDNRNEGVSAEQVEAGVLGVEARDAARVSPVNNVFNEPESAFDFFNSINIDELELTPQQRAAIDDEVELNSLISIEEIREFNQEIQELILDLSNNFGAGDEFFSEIYGRPTPKERATPMSIEEFELIAALEEAVLDINQLIATRQFDDVRSQSSLEYVGGLADDSGIAFDSSSTAKQLVPVPFNLTIEQISARYLGDPDRYNEIITLNNLRSPYIDEDGFFYSFLSNGDGRQFNIESNENLYVGQKVQISSNTVPVFIRKITAIEKITDTNYLITVDGISDLNLLTTNDQAKVKTFLPGTVNSQNQIYIPSDQAVDEEPRTYEIPFLKDDTLQGVSKVDWLLDDNNDIVLNSFGEIGLANGTTNLIQALKMKVQTQKGSLLSDTSFGLGLTPGVNVTDVAVEGVLKDLRDMVLQDSRFEAVEKIEISLLPPDLAITISARLVNGRGIFPINFNVAV
jgi:hypothetical protein